MGILHNPGVIKLNSPTTSNEILHWNLGEKEVRGGLGVSQNSIWMVNRLNGVLSLCFRLSPLFVPQWRVLIQRLPRHVPAVMFTCYSHSHSLLCWDLWNAKLPPVVRMVLLAEGMYSLRLWLPVQPSWKRDRSHFLDYGVQMFFSKRDWVSRRQGNKLGNRNYLQRNQVNSKIE